MSITRLQQARQMYATGQRVAKTMDGSRPGYRGSDYSSIPDSRGRTGKVHSRPDRTDPNPERKVSYSPPSGPDDRSSDLQTINHFINTGQEEKLLPPQLQPPPELKPREQAFQDFVDYRKPVQAFGLSNFFKKPMQVFSDFNASVNRPYFEKVIRAGRIPGLNFDMTKQQFENAYQDYMANRLAGKTDAYGNPMQGFQYGDDGVLTGRFDDSAGGGGGIMDVVVDDTIDDTTTTDDELLLRFCRL